MIAAQNVSGEVEFAAVERWSDSLEELHARIARRFLRPEVAERARRYLAGLLGRVQRRNGCRWPRPSARTGRRVSSAC